MSALKLVVVAVVFVVVVNGVGNAVSVLRTSSATPIPAPSSPTAVTAANSQVATTATPVSVATPDVHGLLPEPTGPSPAATPAPGQFRVESVSVRSNILGHPEAVVTVVNESGVALDALDVMICAFNAYGETVPQYIPGRPSCFKGVANAPHVAAGGTYTETWTLFGQETATKVTAKPLRSHTVSGAVWMP